MAETVRTEAVTVLPEYQETFLKDLLASTSTLADQPTMIPEYQVAGMTPLQQQAIQLGAGIGAYQPMMEAGAATLGQGISQLGPQAYQQYMSPYMDEVLGQSLQDLQRQADIERQRIGSAAIKSGAFGDLVRQWQSKSYSVMWRIDLPHNLHSYDHRHLSLRRIEHNKLVNCSVNLDYSKPRSENQHRLHNSVMLVCYHSLAVWNSNNSKLN